MHFEEIVNSLIGQYKVKNSLIFLGFPEINWNNYWYIEYITSEIHKKETPINNYLTKSQRAKSCLLYKIILISYSMVMKIKINLTSSQENVLIIHTHKNLW